MMIDPFNRNTCAVIAVAVIALIACGGIGAAYAYSSSVQNVGNSVGADVVSLDILEFKNGEWTPITGPLSGTTEGNQFTSSYYKLDVVRPETGDFHLEAWFGLSSADDSWLARFVISSITLKFWNDERNEHTDYTFGIVEENGKHVIERIKPVNNSGTELAEGAYLFTLEIQFKTKGTVSTEYGLDESTYNSLVSKVNNSLLEFKQVRNPVSP